MFSRKYPLIKKTSANYGKIELEDVNVSFDEKNIILKDKSFLQKLLATRKLQNY